MTDDEMDFGKFFDDLRKNASIKAGAVMFGEAQVAYYDTLKEHMSEENAFNLLAHTTECMLKSIASAAGPVTAALLNASIFAERFGKVPVTDKEVPGSGV